MYELRNPDRTVAQCIKYHLTTGDTQVVFYESGDGVRYRLILTRLRTGWPFQTVQAEFSINPEIGGYHVTVSGIGDLVLHASRDVLHYEDVQRNLECRLPTAMVLAEILGHLTGRPYITSEQINTGDDDGR